MSDKKSNHSEISKKQNSSASKAANRPGMTRRQALGVGGATLASAALASVLPASTPAKAQGMRGSHAGGMGAMNEPKPKPKSRPRPAGKPGTYTYPRGNDFYARSVDDWDGFEPGRPGEHYTPVVVPNGVTLPHKIVDGVKIFHMVVEEFLHTFAPGLQAMCWGFNKQLSGPVIEAVEGDRIRIYVTNKLNTKTSVHWHGLLLPSGMDGVGGISQRKIQPGETFMYEWTLNQYGTFMYHSHTDTMTQEGMGLTGMFIVHPRKETEKRADRDFVMLLGEYDIVPGTYRPDPSVFSGFNTLTFNGNCFPGTDPLIAKQGDKVRIRVGNLSAMSHHPIHLHGHAFQIVETDGGAIPPERRHPETSVLCAVGQARAVEFIADNPGDWAMHCHMTHHTMNQMGHGLPNVLGIDHRKLDSQVANLLPGYMTMGANGMGGMAQHAQHMEMPENSIPMVGAPGPHDYIAMGGLVTVFKVREELASYDDPGWYNAPKGTTATTATRSDLRRDGIKI
ncbi:MAG: copper oxidase [Hyphomicrobiaceae bacterium]|nr:copper oxidase [Hyphomicrobiaceae bacterium]